MPLTRVLVTGGSGFLAAHTVAQLLARGDEVRTTVRSSARETDVRAMVAAAGSDDAGLEFTVADLTDDAGWAEAVAGCDGVMHIASPFPPAAPGHEDELIVPAREGTLRVLAAARDAGVRRVVMTSSFAAIGYGPAPAGRPFDERDWTDVGQPGLDPYLKSKTVSERAAWDLVGAADCAMDLTVINPTGIFGPVLGSDFASSVGLVQRMLSGEMPRVPRLFFNVVDVRDVAAAHLLALDSPDAAGERFIVAATPEYSLPEVAKVLKAMPERQASAVSTRVVTDWKVRLGARFRPDLRALAPQVGSHRPLTNAKATERLGWQARDPAETIRDTARSMIEHGLV